MVPLTQHFQFGIQVTLENIAQFDFFSTYFLYTIQNLLNNIQARSTGICPITASLEALYHTQLCLMQRH